MKVEARRWQSGWLCRSVILSLSIAAMGILIGVPLAGAQSTGGRIRGTVTDQSGGAVTAVTVQLLNEATHAKREVQSTTVPLRREWCA